MWKKVKSKVSGLEVFLTDMGCKNSSWSPSLGRKINDIWGFCFVLVGVFFLFGGVFLFWFFWRFFLLVVFLFVFCCCCLENIELGSRFINGVCLLLVYV